MGNAVSRSLLCSHVLRLCEWPNAILCPQVLAVVCTDDWLIEENVTLFKFRIKHVDIFCAIARWEAWATYHRDIGRQEWAANWCWSYRVTSGSSMC